MKKERERVSSPEKKGKKRVQLSISTQRERGSLVFNLFGEKERESLTFHVFRQERDSNRLREPEGDCLASNLLRKGKRESNF